MDTATEVVVVGGGPAGLTLAAMLQRVGVDCVVLERQTRSYVERRQRAGVLEYRAVRMFQEAGLGDDVIGDFPFNSMVEFRIGGERRVVDYAEFFEGKVQCLLPQQVLVQRLIATFLRDGGDLRFSAADVTLHDFASPRVTYRDPAGVTQAVTAQYVAGCDGSLSACREAVPPGALTQFTQAYGYDWLTVLTESPPPPHPLFGVSDHGYAGMFSRGPGQSRFYLQCPVGDDLTNWPDERIWAELGYRLGDPALAAGPITEKLVLTLRSVVYEPMSYERLYLAGDAAHVTVPMGGKGMNLALHDAEVLADGLRAQLRDGDRSGLATYSATCLDRVWRYQDYTRWLIELTHEAGDEATAGPFRKRSGRARLDVLFSSPTARRLFAEYQMGIV